MEPVGAWFSQVGRLHQVYHLWQYPYVSSLLRSMAPSKHQRSSIIQKPTDAQGNARKCMAGGWMGKYGAQGASSYSGLFIRLMTQPIDISTLKDDGLTHFDTAAL